MVTCATRCRRDLGLYRKCPAPSALITPAIFTPGASDGVLPFPASSPASTNRNSTHQSKFARRKDHLPVGQAVATSSSKKLNRKVTSWSALDVSALASARTRAYRPARDRTVSRRASRSTPAACPPRTSRRSPRTDRHQLVPRLVDQFAASLERPYRLQIALRLSKSAIGRLVRTLTQGRPARTPPLSPTRPTHTPAIGRPARISVQHW